MYTTIQAETQHHYLSEKSLKAAEAERKLKLYALDDILSALEELNLKDRTLVPDDVIEQLLTFGIPYDPEIKIPDLIELVFRKQEDFMHVEPDDGDRTPTLEEIEAFFQDSRVA